MIEIPVSWLARTFLRRKVDAQKADIRQQIDVHAAHHGIPSLSQLDNDEKGYWLNARYIIDGGGLALGLNLAVNVKYDPSGDYGDLLDLGKFVANHPKEFGAEAP